MLPNRRIVTGLNEDGRSTILFSGPAPAQDASFGNQLAALWQSATTPADNRGNGDAASTMFDFALGGGGTRFVLLEYPGTAGLSEQERAQRAEAALRDDSPHRRGRSAGPGMHATDTLDYVVLLRGEITLVVECGEVAMKAGDVLVDRGIVHAFQNRGKEPALLAAVMIDAVPLIGA